MCKMMMMVITRWWYDYQLKTRCKLKGWSRTCYFEVLWYYKYMSVQIFQNIQKKVMWKIWMKAQRSETGMVAQWLLRALKGRVCAPSGEVEVSIPSCCSYHETAPMALLWDSHWAPHLGREVHKKTAQGSGAMNILWALGSPKGAVWCTIGDWVLWGPFGWTAYLTSWLAWLSSQRLGHLLIGDRVPWGPLGWTAYLTSWLAGPRL